MASQLRELGAQPAWRGAPMTPGAYGNNPMAPPHGAAPAPKWINALTSLVQGIGDAISAPKNALTGSYPVYLDPSAPGSVDPYSAMIPDAINLSGLANLGGATVPSDAASLRMGLAARRATQVPDAGLTESLPMDTGSRMARAKAAGFRTNMPLFHGTDQSFSAFDPSLGGSTTGAAPARTGAAWVALDPQTADEFANLAAKAHGGSPQVYPLVHRALNPAVVNLDGTETNMEIAATLADAFDNGYDAVMFRNYTTPSGQAGKNIIVVRDPQQLRSPFAAFNPKNLASPNLLAGVAGVGALPAIGSLNALTQEPHSNVSANPLMGF